MNKARSEPHVSVCVVTYNQRSYVEQCITSILEQETDFHYEIVISDDASSDGTAEILRTLANQNPQTIRLVSPSKNIGAFANYRHVHQQAQGVFVAHIDGDDYFLPGKLQKQVTFIERNTSSALCAHIMAVNKNGMVTGLTRRNPKSVSLSYLLKKHPAFLNSSIMYRRAKLQPVFFTDLNILDFYVYVQACKLGPIGFQNEVLASYRANVGISSDLSLLPQIMLAIDSAAEVMPDSAVQKARSRQYLRYALAALRAGDNEKFTRLITDTEHFRNNLALTRLVFWLRNRPGLLLAAMNSVRKPREWAGSLRNRFARRS